MATIKSHTDLSQSKTLSKILRHETADMFYVAGKGEPIFIGNRMVACGDDDYDALGGPDVLCWSLTSLLSVLPNPSLHKTFSGWRCDSDNKEWTSCILGEPTDNPIDACVAMIKKLHELKML